jgi:hypothetical protein
MSIIIKHTDKSGLQWFTPSPIFTPIEANDYIKWMEKKFGLVSYTLKIDNFLLSERKDHNKPSIIYLQNSTTDEA